MAVDAVAEMLGATRDGDRAGGMAGLGDGDDSDNVGGVETGWGPGFGGGNDVRVGHYARSVAATVGGLAEMNVIAVGYEPDIPLLEAFLVTFRC